MSDGTKKARLICPRAPKNPPEPKALQVGDWVTHEGDANGRRAFLGCQCITAVAGDLLTVEVRDLGKVLVGEATVPRAECKLFHGFPGARRPNPSMRHLYTEEARQCGRVSYMARFYPGDAEYLALFDAWSAALRERMGLDRPGPDLMTDDAELSDDVFRIHMEYDCDWGRWRFSIDHATHGDMYLLDESEIAAAGLSVECGNRAWFLMDESRIRERHKARDAALSFLRRYGHGEVKERLFSVSAQGMVLVTYAGRGRYERAVA